MSKRVGIYGRVSTDDQADSGYSLPGQMEACRANAGRLSYPVIVEFQEDHSGKVPIAERPEGRKLAEMVKRRELDAVIVHQVDRLSRDIVDLLATVRQWLWLGVEIYAGDIGEIKSELDIALIIKAWQGGDEWAKIRERSMRGKRQKAKSGKVVGCRPPYGLTHVRDSNGKVVTLVPHEAEAPIVRLIYQWYVLGDETGAQLSAGKIARRLAEIRVPTPAEGKKGYHRKRESGMWTSNKILEFVSHEVYAGVWRYGVRVGNSRSERPLDEQIIVKVTPLIDRELWEAAQQQRAQ